MRWTKENSRTKIFSPATKCSGFNQQCFPLVCGFVFLFVCLLTLSDWLKLCWWLVLCNKTKVDSLLQEVTTGAVIPVIFFLPTQEEEEFPLSEAVISPSDKQKSCPVLCISPLLLQNVYKMDVSYPKPLNQSFKPVSAIARTISLTSCLLITVKVNQSIDIWSRFSFQTTSLW